MIMKRVLLSARCRPSILNSVFQGSRSTLATLEPSLRRTRVWWERRKAVKTPAHSKAMKQPYLRGRECVSDGPGGVEACAKGTHVDLETAPAPLFLMLLASEMIPPTMEPAFLMPTQIERKRPRWFGRG
jgi:hypothetical protein